MEKSAVIIGPYRYELRRVWDRAKPILAFVMLNPSTADADIDDPTIRSCIRISTSWGFGGFIVVNLFAWRATDPMELYVESRPVVGPQNNKYIENAILEVDIVICAWGSKDIARTRGHKVRQMIRSAGKRPLCLGPNNNGTPCHPLFMPTHICPKYFPLRS